MRREGMFAWTLGPIVGKDVARETNGNPLARRCDPRYGDNRHHHQLHEEEYYLNLFLHGAMSKPKSKSHVHSNNNNNNNNNSNDDDHDDDDDDDDDDEDEEEERNKNKDRNKAKERASSTHSHYYTNTSNNRTVYRAKPGLNNALVPRMATPFHTATTSTMPSYSGRVWATIYERASVRLHRPTDDHHHTALSSSSMVSTQRSHSSSLHLDLEYDDDENDDEDKDEYEDSDMFKSRSHATATISARAPTKFPRGGSTGKQKQQQQHQQIDDDVIVLWSMESPGIYSLKSAPQPPRVPPPAPAPQPQSTSASPPPAVSATATATAAATPRIVRLGQSECIKLVGVVGNLPSPTPLSPHDDRSVKVGGDSSEILANDDDDENDGVGSDGDTDTPQTTQQARGERSPLSGSLQAVEWSPDGLVLAVASRTHIHFYVDANRAAPMLLPGLRDSLADLSALDPKIAQSLAEPQLVHTYKEPIYFPPQSLVLALTHVSVADSVPPQPQPPPTAATTTAPIDGGNVDGPGVPRKGNLRHETSYIMVVGGAAGAEVFKVSVRVWLQQPPTPPPTASRGWLLTGSVKVESLGMTVSRLQVCQMTCDSKGTRLAVATLDGHVSIWSLLDWSFPPPSNPSSTASSNSEESTSTAEATAGSASDSSKPDLADGGDNDGDQTHHQNHQHQASAEFYDLATSSGERITSLSFSPDGNCLLVACWDGTTVVYSRNNKQAVPPSKATTDATTTERVGNSDGDDGTAHHHHTSSQAAWRKDLLKFARVRPPSSILRHTPIHHRHHQQSRTPRNTPQSRANKSSPQPGSVAMGFPSFPSTMPTPPNNNNNNNNSAELTNASNAAAAVAGKTAAMTRTQAALLSASLISGIHAVCWSPNGKYVWLSTLANASLELRSYERFGYLVNTETQVVEPVSAQRLVMTSNSINSCECHGCDNNDSDDDDDVVEGDGDMTDTSIKTSAGAGNDDGTSSSSNPSHLQQQNFSDKPSLKGVAQWTPTTTDDGVDGEGRGGVSPDKSLVDQYVSHRPGLLLSFRDGGFYFMPWPIAALLPHSPPQSQPTPPAWKLWERSCPCCRSDSPPTEHRRCELWARSQSLDYSQDAPVELMMRLTDLAAVGATRMSDTQDLPLQQQQQPRSPSSLLIRFLNTSLTLRRIDPDVTRMLSVCVVDVGRQLALVQPNALFLCIFAFQHALSSPRPRSRPHPPTSSPTLLQIQKEEDDEEIVICRAPYMTVSAGGHCIINATFTSSYLITLSSIGPAPASPDAKPASASLHIQDVVGTHPTQWLTLSVWTLPPPPPQHQHQTRPHATRILQCQLSEILSSASDISSSNINHTRRRRRRAMNQDSDDNDHCGASEGESDVLHMTRGFVAPQVIGAVHRDVCYLAFPNALLEVSIMPTVDRSDGFKVLRWWKLSSRIIINAIIASSLTAFTSTVTRASGTEGDITQQIDDDDDDDDDDAEDEENEDDFGDAAQPCSWAWYPTTTSCLHLSCNANANVNTNTGVGATKDDNQVEDLLQLEVLGPLLTLIGGRSSGCDRLVINPNHL